MTNSRELLKEYIKALLFKEIFSDEAFAKSEKRRKKFPKQFDLKKDAPRVSDESI